MLELKKLKSPLFKILSENAKVFIFDTETSGLGTSKDPAEMIEFSGLKYKIKKDVKLNFDSNTKELEINFNGKNIKFKTEEDNIDVNLDEFNIKLNSEETLIIKYGIPVIKKKNKYILPFNSFGEFELEETIDQMYNSKKGIEPGATNVHKIYNKSQILNDFENIENLKNYARTILNTYKESYYEKVIDSMTKKIEKKEEQIKKIDTNRKKTNLDEKLSKLLKNEVKTMLDEVKSLKSDLTNIKKYITFVEKNKNIDEIKENLLIFLKEYNFRNNSEEISLESEHLDELKKIFNDNNNVLVGHNIFNFDIKNILEPVIGEIENPNVIDTMFFPMEYNKKSKTRATLDKFISVGIENVFSNLKKEIDLFQKSNIKHTNRTIENKKEEFIDIFKLKIFRNKTLTEEEKIEVLKLMNDLSNIEGVNLKLLLTKEELNHINYINSLIEEREGVHTSLLDIKLNLFAWEHQIIEYISIHGLEDVLVENSEIKNLTKIENIEPVEVSTYLGLKTSFSNNVITKNTDIVQKAKELELKNIAISDSSFTDSYDNQKIIEKSGIKNIISVEVELTYDEYDDLPDFKDKTINIIFPTQKDYFNSILLINDYKINYNDLKLLLNKTGIKLIISSEMDSFISNKNVFVKVEPYSLENYNSEFKNKRVLWINNKYTENSKEEKTLQYVWKNISNNSSLNLVTMNNIYKYSEDYQDYHIPSKIELSNIFPVENFKDIYENSDIIANECVNFDIEAKHLPIIPTLKRLQNDITENPETPAEYKEIMKEFLKKQWKAKDMESLLKIKTLKTYFKNKLKEFDSLSYVGLQTISSEERTLIRKIINTDLSIMNKEELLEMSNLELKKVGKTHKEQELINEYKELYNFKKQEYGDRIKYELDSLENFENYEIVFNYYYLMRKILKVLEAKGISHGPGRGSAAGSIIAFLMEITDIDPVDDDLLFERFMNPERVSMPDIDTDLPMSKEITKDLIIDILENAFKLSDEEATELLGQFDFYDKEVIQASLNKLRYTAKISTVMYSSEKTVFGDMFRLLGVPAFRLSPIKRAYNADINISENFNSIPEVDSYMNSLKFLSSDLRKLGDLVSAKGKHAGGVNISGGPANAHAMNEDNTNVFTKDAAANESKMDLLGLIGQKLIDELDSIEEISEKTQRIEKIDYNFSITEDLNIWKLIQDGMTANVFQIESDGMKKMLKKLAPLDFDTLVAALALYRPGPMEAGSVDEYIINKYIDFQKKYSRYVEPVLGKRVKNGSFTKEDSDKIYDYIDNKKFKKLIDKNLFLDIMNAIPYTKTNEFKSRVDSSIDEIINIVRNDPDVSDEEALEIKNSIIEDPEKQSQELKTIEKEFLKFYRDTGSVDKSKEKTLAFAAKIEDEIKSSEVYIDITKETYGTIIYQEQIMQIASRIAGFTKGESDALRKVIAKSKQLQIMKFKDHLVEGFTNRIDKINFKNGNTIYRNSDFETIINIDGKEINLFNSPFTVVDNKLEISYTPSAIKKKKILNELKIETIEELDNIVKNEITEVLNVNTMGVKAANYLFDNIVGFGSYAFNKSHSASYARLTYKTAYYKYYYPEKFYSISLKYASKKSIQALLREITNETDIDITLPSINSINKEFDYDLKEHKILFSPNKLKSIKGDAVYAIFNEIQKGVKFNSLFDLKLKLGSLADKATIKQLGVSNILKEISGPLTPKIFNEFDMEINNALKSFSEDRLKEISLQVKDKKEFAEYFKLKNTIKKNDIINLQIEENNSLLVSIKEKYENSSENEFVDKEEINMGVGEVEEVEEISQDKLLVELENLESKLKIITDEDNELIEKIETLYKNQINEYFDISKINIDQTLITYIEKEILSDEKSQRFLSMIENKTDFSQTEKDEINMKLFAEYNFAISNVDLTNRTIKKEELEKEIQKYYEEIKIHLQSNSEFQNNEKIANLSEPYYYIGKNPKIIIITENTFPSRIDTIFYKGEELKEEKKSFQTPDGKTVAYSRYNDKSGNEYKYDSPTGKVQLCEKSGGKTVYTNLDKKDLKFSRNNNFAFNFFKEVLKINPLLNMDDVAIMSFYPFNKKDLPKKVVNDSVYTNKLKKMLQNTKPGLVMPTGVELIKAVKGMHLFKREEFDTVYHVPYHFNFDDKGKNTEDQIFTKVIFFENPNLDYQISMAVNDKDKKELENRLAKIKKELQDSIICVKNNTIEEEELKNTIENQESINLN